MNISPQYLAALAVEAIQGLDAVGTRGQLARNDDYVTGTVIDARGRHWRVTYPANAFAATALEAEMALAPELLNELRASNLPFDIMRPAGFATVPGGRAAVYPEPFGKAIEFEDMTPDEARSLARAIAAIHLLPERVISDAGLPVYSADEWRRRLLAELSDADHTGYVPPLLRRRWDDALTDSSLWRFTPCVIHGDLAGENFLWSNGSIATVLGWGEARVGDPAHDLASLLPLPDELLLPAIESYENVRGATLDEPTRLRAVFMSEFSILRWLMHGVRTDVREIQIEAVKMLDELADQVALDPDLANGPSWHMDIAEGTVYGTNTL